MIGHPRLIVASAVFAELFMLRIAPVLVESFTQLHTLAWPGSNAAAYPERTRTLANARSNSNNSDPGSSLSTTRLCCGKHDPSNQRRLASSSTLTDNPGSQAGVEPTSTASSSPSLSSSSSPTGSSSDQEQRQGAYRRGFGAKVALPSTDILHEVLVGHDATFKMRAYHIGARIHIGQVLRRALLEGCRTNSGKDYCIIWLKPDRHRFQGGRSSSSSSRHGTDSPSSSKANIRVPFLPMPSSSSSSSFSRQELLNELERWLRSILASKQDPAKLDNKATASPQQSSSSWQYIGMAGHSALRRRMDMYLRSSMLSHQVDPLLVVYRYGSVVFAGTRPEDEPGLVDEYVPSSVRYKAGGDSTWAQPNPMLHSRSPAEEHTVKVSPGQQEHVIKGVDQVVLRVLDVGGVRVLTSVLAQSAALKFYEMSVAEALDKLAQYRARVRTSSQAGRSSWLGSVSAVLTGTSGEQERTFFKVIAASALVTSEARQLLEMAEPAWQYAAYHSIWALAADEFELESRFKALEMKLHQVEQEAKHDVKDKEGRRYHRLEQSVVLLLVASCLLAALEVTKKALGRPTLHSRSTAKSHPSSSSSSIKGVAVDVGGQDLDAAVAAVASGGGDSSSSSSSECDGERQGSQCAAQQQ